jgi:HD-like signal output (HDOD) protein
MAKPSSKNINSMMERLSDLPTLPGVVQHVLEAINDPKTSAPMLAEVIQRDPVLTSKVFVLVNSSFFHLGTPITDLGKAISFLGFNAINLLVLSTGVFSTFELDAVADFNIIEFWRHSLASGIAAQKLAQRVNYPHANDVFACGLFHDLGILALFHVSRDEFKAVFAKVLLEERSFLEAETELGLPGHTVLGELLAEKWRLPMMIRKSIRFHHQDIEKMTSISAELKAKIMFATLGNVLANRWTSAIVGNKHMPTPPANYMKLLTLNAADIAAVEAVLPAEMEGAEGFLKASEEKPKAKTP